jgi:hypothetical protein
METICGQTGQYGFWCGVYDFQTPINDALAIMVAIAAGIPVWRQLKYTNLQLRISHRGTLHRQIIPLTRDQWVDLLDTTIARSEVLRYLLKGRMPVTRVDPPLAEPPGSAAFAL